MFYNYAANLYFTDHRFDSESRQPKDEYEDLSDGKSISDFSKLLSNAG